MACGTDLACEDVSSSLLVNQWATGSWGPEGCCRMQDPSSWQMWLCGSKWVNKGYADTALLTLGSFGPLPLPHHGQSCFYPHCSCCWSHHHHPYCYPHWSYHSCCFWSHHPHYHLPQSQHCHPVPWVGSGW